MVIFESVQYCSTELANWNVTGDPPVVSLKDLTSGSMRRPRQASRLFPGIVGIIITKLLFHNA
jgi:hypothetical protein